MSFILSLTLSFIVFHCSCEVYYGQPELHLWNEWEFVYRETQLKAGLGLKSPVARST